MRQIAARGITDFPELEKYEEIGEALSTEEALALTEELSPPMAMASGSYPIDVLVLYTQGVRNNMGSTSATVNWINTMIVDFNQKLSGAGISTHYLSLQTTLETKWPTFPTPYNENSTHNSVDACVGSGTTPPCDSIVADQRWLANDVTVANLRETHAADLVILITADDQKHVLDTVHGYAGLKPSDHGARCSPSGSLNRTCGEFVTVRDIFALSNLTFTHEVGHAIGLIDGPKSYIEEGVLSFGWDTFGQEQTSYSNHIAPMTMMANLSPVCMWSNNNSNSSCRTRLPWFVDADQYRTMFYTFNVPRKFSPNNDVETEMRRGLNWVLNRCNPSNQPKCQ